MDPDQDRKNVGPDLDPNFLTLLIVFLEEVFGKVSFHVWYLIVSIPDLCTLTYFEKVSRRKQKHGKLPSMQRVKLNSKFSLLFTGTCKSCLSRELWVSQICLLLLVAKIEFSRKFLNLQYYFLVIHFQVTIICQLSVIVSIFAQPHEIEVGIPKENHLNRHHDKNETDNSTIKFKYTGLSAQTFRDNLYRKYRNRIWYNYWYVEVDIECYIEDLPWVLMFYWIY